jgi:Na+-transporting methylmalonyl-CoA/oxaloacetate decarboxylase gamma subunit
MENIGAAVSVTFIGMGVIFVVLTVLLFTIIVLNKFFPYVAPPPPGAKKHNAGGDAETVAVIQAALTAYLGRQPGKITILK